MQFSNVATQGLFGFKIFLAVLTNEKIALVLHIGVQDIRLNDYVAIHAPFS